jgi:hypothetical protein
LQAGFLEESIGKIKKSRIHIVMDVYVGFYKKISDEEINNPQWTETKQFLEVNNFEKVNNEYIYERYSIGCQHYCYSDWKIYLNQ